jgi:multiple sugar transport system ATP-binding protein
VALGGALRVKTPAPTATARTKAKHREAVAGIRPEDIEIVDEHHADVNAQVELVEPLGRELLVHVNAPDSAHTQLRVLVATGTSVTTGSVVGLRLRAQRIHFFDPGTEMRMVDPLAEEKLAGYT